MFIHRRTMIILKRTGVCLTDYYTRIAVVDTEQNNKSKCCYFLQTHFINKLIFFPLR